MPCGRCSEWLPKARGLWRTSTFGVPPGVINWEIDNFGRVAYLECPRCNKLAELDHLCNEGVAYNRTIALQRAELHIDRAIAVLKSAIQSVESSVDPNGSVRQES